MRREPLEQVKKHTCRAYIWWLSMLRAFMDRYTIQIPRTALGTDSCVLGILRYGFVWKQGNPKSTGFHWFIIIFHLFLSLNCNLMCSPVYPILEVQISQAVTPYPEVQTSHQVWKDRLWAIWRAWVPTRSGHGERCHGQGLYRDGQARQGRETEKGWCQCCHGHTVGCPLGGWCIAYTCSDTNIATLGDGYQSINTWNLEGLTYTFERIFESESSFMYDSCIWWISDD